MLEDVQLTRHGISKLAKLQGKFYKSDIVIQLLREDNRDEGPDELGPVNEYNATVADATYCFPAIVVNAHNYDLDQYEGPMA